MSKAPAIQLYTGDWMKDPQLSMCSASTRGIWIDMLCAMHESKTGRLQGTVDQLSRLCRATTKEMEVGLQELAQTKTANVTKRHKNVTVVCRRLEREAKARQDNALRQRRRRGHGNVTDGGAQKSLPGTSSSYSSSTSKGSVNTFLFSKDELITSAQFIYGRLRYRGGDGAVLWKVAGLLRARVVSEAEVCEAVESTSRAGPRHKIRYFVKTLDNVLHKRDDPLSLTQLTEAIALRDGSWPQDPPEGLDL